MHNRHRAQGGLGAQSSLSGFCAIKYHMKLTAQPVFFWGGGLKTQLATQMSEKGVNANCMSGIKFTEAGGSFRRLL